MEECGFWYLRHLDTQRKEQNLTYTYKLLKIQDIEVWECSLEGLQVIPFNVIP